MLHDLANDAPTQKNYTRQTADTIGPRLKVVLSLYKRGIRGLNQNDDLSKIPHLGFENKAQTRIPPSAFTCCLCSNRRTPTLDLLRVLAENSKEYRKMSLHGQPHETRKSWASLVKERHSSMDKKRAASKEEKTHPV